MSDHSAPRMTPDEALRTLKEGNQRFREGGHLATRRDLKQHLATLSKAQRPLCVLVGCSDSRVSPELLFGLDLGDLFIVRNAGNCVDLAAMGSIQYGVAVLGAPLVLVLGHQSCGAVQAAVDVVEKDATFPGSIGQMIEPILPAVIHARREGADDLLDRSVRENVARIVHRLRTTDQIMLPLLESGALKVVGARYDLEHGSVDIIA